ncbi:hypothetical protein F5Y18DRAFT_417585 [Xylariaceae sp. FL1019]|nr:hypothetical protein F5Y18DRAFT_417585 [Xylariaceae sp. FL1019]
MASWLISPRFFTSRDLTIRLLEVPTPAHAQRLCHVDQIAQILRDRGALIATLTFRDDKSEYLRGLVLSLHRHHGHQLPIAHSATRGWFWDVRPRETDFQQSGHQARSETMETFPWHTDCSYEEMPPRYFALQVLQHDRFGGGTLSLMNTNRLIEYLSTSTRDVLMRPEYRITIPPEFAKSPVQQYIQASLLRSDASSESSLIRYREDILTATTEKAAQALKQLKETLQNCEVRTTHLTARDLPSGSIILIDNRRWLHARTQVRDPSRHLPYSMADVLAVAKLHPFYNRDVQYPPDSETIRRARELADEGQTDSLLKEQPFLWRSRLYEVVERLIDDTSPQNTYRHSAYTSTTGGGGGSMSLLFCTDVHENRRQRREFGLFLRALKIVSEHDWVISVQFSGSLCRSLDLTSEILENAGASVLSAGQYMATPSVVKLLIRYHANVLCGEANQLVSVVQCLAALPGNERCSIRLDKIIYTSELLTVSQRSYIIQTLGPIDIYSLLGSAEAGPYAVSGPGLTEQDLGASYDDFVFDTRTTLIEILPPSASEQDDCLQPLGYGQRGVIAQTCLTRLRNPIVRYVTGDVGSIHDLPSSARSLIGEVDWGYMRVLRLYGRDRRFSFVWDGEYIEFHRLGALMNNEEHKVLQWQLILGELDHSPERTIELRVLCADLNTTAESNRALIGSVEGFFNVYEENRHRFRLVFCENIDCFERSLTGRKIIKFVDRCS